MAFEIDLSGKVAVITGASSGLGKGIATMMAKAGATVAGCALEENLPDFWSTLDGSNHFYKKCDVTQNIESEIFIKKVIEKYGRIDILISNAGANIFEGAIDCTEDSWNNNHALNLKSHWQVAKLAYDSLKKSKGVIIIISSNHAMQTMKNVFPYNVTKSALLGLVKSLCIEWSPDIRTVGIAPGFIQTPGNDNWFNSFPDPVLKEKETVKLHPVKKLGTIEEIGAWCVFLASDFSAFAAGTTYVIDGGRSAVLQDD